MLSTTRTRLALSAAAAATVIGGLFIAAPANAATPEITLVNSTFTAGDWGTGLDVSGSGYTAGATVNITVHSTEDGIVLGKMDVTADATGAFTNAVLMPTGSLPLPQDGFDVVVMGTEYSPYDRSNLVALDVRAPSGISASSTSISTADLTNPEVGIRLTASGYTPGEEVTLSTTFTGPVPAIAYVADRSGTVQVGLYQSQGVAKAGEIGFTLTGETSGVANSITITVTGETIDLGPGPSAPAPLPAPETTTTGKLPRVSG
ncbi:hypothetical protein ACFRFH_01035 [Leifsonia sp. NPDC056824]|uniref:hypothetical protein n=1 Tax=Leifsonia sp. NPDC056824 TaxID=3345953 RepID=UPI003675443E